MSEQNVHEMWSDDDLDLALAALRSDVDTDVARLAGIRGELFGSTDTPAPAPSRTWIRWAAVAAAVAVLVGAVFVVLARRGDDKPVPPATPPAVSPIERIKAVDEPQRAGQFRYVGTHGWLLGQSDTFAYVAETTTTTWVPAQERQDWMQRRTVSGQRKFLFGTEADARKQDALDMWPAGTWHARCGDFLLEQPLRCTGKAYWGEPDEEFMDSLPRDPQQLYDRLSAEAKGGQSHEHRMFTTAADLLRNGTAPADLRLALYRALAKLPHLEVAEGVANLDGRTGVSLAITGSATHEVIIVDPATGQFIGERVVTTIAEAGVAADEVIVDTAVRYGVVDQQGDEPAH